MARELQLNRKKNSRSFRSSYYWACALLEWGINAFPVWRILNNKSRSLVRGHYGGSWRCHPSKRRRVIIESDDEDELFDPPHGESRTKSKIWWSTEQTWWSFHKLKMLHFFFINLACIKAIWISRLQNTLTVCLLQDRKARILVPGFFFRLRKKLCNKPLINLACSVCTEKYQSWLYESRADISPYRPRA